MRCDVCGNDGGNAFQIIAGGRTMTFDAFECAVGALAPRCGHCECMITGHAVEAGEAVFCCDDCARAAADDQILASSD